MRQLSVDLQSLWRGLNIEHVADDYTGDSILDYLGVEGAILGHGIGRHWTVIEDVADGYAEIGEFDSGDRYDAGGPTRLQVRVRADWDGSGLDPEHTGRGIDPTNPPRGLDSYEESERTLLPGTVLVINDVRVRRPNIKWWQPLRVRQPLRNA